MKLCGFSSQAQGTQGKYTEAFLAFEKAKTINSSSILSGLTLAPSQVENVIASSKIWYLVTDYIGIVKCSEN
jgi:hypothetical protein